MKEEIDSPTGIDLEPEPPGAVTLSKRAGFVALAVVAAVFALVGYGVLTRGQGPASFGFQVDEKRGITAATDAGKVVASQVPGRLVLGAAAMEAELPVAAVAPTPVYGVAQPVAMRPAPVESPPPVAPREVSPEERRLAALYAREQEAIHAPTSVRAGAGGGSTPSPPVLDRVSPARNELAQIASGLLGRAGGAAAGTSDDQDRKEAFLDKARRNGGSGVEHRLQSSRTEPAGKYEIKAGWDIPAVLEQSLNSDLPGEVKALVRENVFDTATGRHLLIPQGARLVGLYDSRIAYGQDGIMVVWNRVIFPDGSSINLEGMSGQDARGNTGLRYDVDNHYRRLLGFGLLTSAFSAAFQLSQTRRGGLLGYPSTTEVAGSAVGREMSQLGADVTRRNLNVQPTIKVPVGYRFNVRVNRDMLFERPYEP